MEKRSQSPKWHKARTQLDPEDMDLDEPKRASTKSRPEGGFPQPLLKPPASPCGFSRQESGGTARHRSRSVDLSMSVQSSSSSEDETSARKVLSMTSWSSRNSNGSIVRSRRSVVGESARFFPPRTSLPIDKTDRSARRKRTATSSVAAPATPTIFFKRQSVLQQAEFGAFCNASSPCLDIIFRATRCSVNAQWSEVFKRLARDHQMFREDLPRALELCGVWKPKAEWIESALSLLECKFSTVNHEEFLTIVTHCFDELYLFFDRTFTAIDQDGSGFIDRTQLGELLTMDRFEIEPLRYVLDEVMAECDSAGQGLLDMNSFSMFMSVILQRELFTRREYTELLHVYHQLDVDKSGEIDSSEFLSIMSFLGITLTESQSEEIFREVDIDGSGSISEREFFLCMRRIRDKEIASFKACIDKNDTDGNGMVSLDEVEHVLKAMGHIVHNHVVEDTFVDSGLDPNKDMDISDFFTFMMAFREREGLAAEDLTLIMSVMKAYAPLEGGKGEVLRDDIGLVLRSIGFPIPHEQKQRLLNKVCFNRDSSVNLRQLKKIVRMCYEDELAEILGSYDRFPRKESKDSQFSKVSQSTKGITHGWIRAALAGLELRTGLEIELDIPEDLSTYGFEDYVKAVTLALKDAHIRFRESGCFTKIQVERYRLAFEAFDKDKSGDISYPELVHTLETLFDDVLGDPTLRPALVRIVREADENSKGSYDFKRFLIIMRKLQDVADISRAKKEHLVISQSDFDAREIEVFRELFCAACFVDGSRISMIELKNLIAPICPLGDRNAEQFRTVLSSITGREERENSLIDFPDFIMLMRRLLDSNFAGIIERSRTFASRRAPSSESF